MCFGAGAAWDLGWEQGKGWVWTWLEHHQPAEPLSAFKGWQTALGQGCNSADL